MSGIRDAIRDRGRSKRGGYTLRLEQRFFCAVKVFLWSKGANFHAYERATVACGS